MTANTRLVGWTVLILINFGFVGSSRASDEPLAARVDALVEAKLGGQPVSAISDDAEFMRRVFLDLTGRIPSVVEAREFWADSATDKRVKLIDRLLGGDEFPRRMTELMHIHLMERRGDNPEWLAYLKASFQQNKPWDQMCREMLSPDPKNEQTRGAGFFLSKRLENYGQNPVDHATLTRDVSRLMLGMDLQCAQCHDHLFIKEYKQADFQGLFTVFLNTSLRNDVKFPAVGEKLMSQKIEFQSVFNPEKKSVGPRVPGRTEITIPEFAKGEEYLEPPDKKTKDPGRLKFSPLEHLAADVTSAENTAFSRNTANRIWFVVMGRGLVHPLDLHHTENPASHPELLDLLAHELTEHKFDLKWLIRELLLTKTYQRSSLFVVPPSGGAKDDEDRLKAELRTDRYAVALEKPLSAEQLFLSTLHATGHIEPVKSDTAADPTTTSDARSGQSPNLPDAKFDALRQKFLKAFANPPMEPEGEFAPSLRAALYLMNDPDMLKLLDAQPGNLITRLKDLSATDQITDELYVSILSRRPTADEIADVADQLQRAGDKKEFALKHLAWALLASTEFCLNH